MLSAFTRGTVLLPNDDVPPTAYASTERFEENLLPNGALLPNSAHMYFTKGQINPPSSKGHKFVLLATDYFTKWVETIPLKKVTSENMVEFVKEHIIYRFGIPQTITADQGTQFTSSEFRDFAESMDIKLLNSSPYYAQANGQAEASNKIMIKII
jgi:hypothetical protein